MKRWLRKPALAQPRLSFVREQALAKEPAALLDHVVFEEVLRIADQHPLDQVRIVQEVNVQPRRAVVEDVTELPRPFEKRGERITVRQRHVADEKVRLGSGRTFHRLPGRETTSLSRRRIWCWARWAN